jgi:acyl-CoA synthetase (AMP-forming)/AMP-acid ligase II
VCTRGYHVMTGYFNDPDKTAAAIDADGWLHTGDLASMDQRGYCRIAGRLKDMIIRGGENIYPREIEQVLFEHPTVADVAVVGVPDAKWGEQVAAFVRPAPGQAPDPDELFALLPRAPRAAQDAPLLDHAGGVLAHAVGQDPEVRAAGALPRPGARRRDPR